MITGELRRYASGFAGMLGVTTAATTTDVNDDLEEIADRIDQEHEECEGFCRRLEDAASKGEEVTLFGTDYVPLPKDADGETIHLGDELEEGKVARIVIRDDGEHSVYLYKLPNVLHEYFCADVGHVHPDSWERIIRDAQGDGILNQIDGRPSDFEALVERCKRLAGEDA